MRVSTGKSWNELVKRRPPVDLLGNRCFRKRCHGLARERVVQRNAMRGVAETLVVAELGA